MAFFKRLEKICHDPSHAERVHSEGVKVGGGEYHLMGQLIIKCALPRVVKLWNKKDKVLK